MILAEAKVNHILDSKTLETFCKEGKVLIWLDGTDEMDIETTLSHVEAQIQEAKKRPEVVALRFFYNLWRIVYVYEFYSNGECIQYVRRVTETVPRGMWGM